MSLRRLFLAGPPPDGAPTLAEGESHHALHVLRLGPGDEFLGLDGAGAAWPLRIVSLERGRPLLELAGPPRRQDPLQPRVTLIAPLPRGGRAEEMLNRLTQLGVSAFLPTWFERTQGGERRLSPNRAERLLRTLRESCKQCGRLWLPEFAPPASLDERLAACPEPGGDAGGTRVFLDPGSPISFARWRADCGGEVQIFIGPEGGLSPRERDALGAAGARPLGLGPLILRIETAAELACGLARQLPWDPTTPPRP